MKGIICGKGGQGVITLNRQIGSVLSNFGVKIISAETHGMAMRGGSVSTFLKVGDYYSASFGSGEADFIISTDKNEFLLNDHFLIPDGVAIINSIENLENKNSNIIIVDATNLSLKLFDNPKYTNWFLFFIFFKAFREIFDFDEIIEIVLNYKMLTKDILDKILGEI
ncbi:2-oxoacid:acceptor oxidoreductase family protein [Deferribacter abyssi]|uniref:2-oxoacid:acceptor oxidoreductase family protein n=1 Tax=Deferribacter abyssi TaxID=213806 RepID=UPI003C223F9C